MMIEKIKWVFAVLIVFLVILGTNLIDRRNFKQLKNSVENIYDDRMVASNLIYRMTSLLRNRELLIVRSDTTHYDERVRVFEDKFKDIISEYRSTNLTDFEQIELSRVIEAKNQLSRIEEQHVQLGQHNLDVIVGRYDRIYRHMDELSTIQMEESAKQKRISQKAMDSVEFFTNIEIYMLVFLGVLAQVIILYRSK
ncbi:MCP four helix bundle domain-containing protein [Phaeocystidibacter marisrubri]|uniref:Chemotaxis methyl-accepting receptor HlyB-like 4HB MCP domain-containing protein n=1 Tax=Phaeocystidibacter marisrubri TaxID=1577780 RepID=A0A6L3ZCQ3_9FLAO|nr:MCP four helix bundle domain-containing protein [Phaeocystidibacter marisrubri]KAB2815625.1 hypothetical protein F8C82_07940 [Phaeocystidibacter marisrubri]GGH64867.1 hypothetical protein GCM10011318_01300 [Phaeocystidibacter marisrubri]